MNDQHLNYFNNIYSMNLSSNKYENRDNSYLESWNRSIINNDNRIKVDEENSSSISLIRHEYCLICNDRSSGIHFGISTCEACKAFYRRTNLSSMNSSFRPCSPIRCEINIENRNNCPSCRYDKCKRLGMDRNNVIYGKPSKQKLQIVLNQYQLESNFRKRFELFSSIIYIYSKSKCPDNYYHFSMENQQILYSFYQNRDEIFLLSKSSSEKSFPSIDQLHRILLGLFSPFFNCHFQYFSTIDQNYYRLLLLIWLFVYLDQIDSIDDYFIKQNQSILINYLDFVMSTMDLSNFHHNNSQQMFKIHFVNLFTILIEYFLNFH